SSGKEAVPADGDSTVPSESQSCLGNHRDTDGLGPFPRDLAPENQELEIQSELSDLEKGRAPDSSLGSCTVVEGLLFPIEYYVRTTRRMSSCQRKVDLDAVILSQLGRAKRGQRGKSKQKDQSSDQPSQERTANDLELGVSPVSSPGAENDLAGSSSPQKACSSGSSTSLGSVSQSSIAGTHRGRRRSQRKRRSVCTSPAQLVSQELTESLVPGESSALLSEHQSEEEISEANLRKVSLDERRFPAATASRPEGPAVDPSTRGSLFSFRSLQWLVPRLGVSDFDLPDWEFGQLKLEKLDSPPTRGLEAFVPWASGGAVDAGDRQDAQPSPEDKALRRSLLSPCGSPQLPHIESPVSRRDLSTHELLLTPPGTVLAAVPAEPESQISSPAFPVVGATPALLPPVQSELFPSSPTAPLAAGLCPSRGASAGVVDDGQCQGRASPRHLASGGAAGDSREEEQQGTAFPLGAERGPGGKCAEAAAAEKHPQPGSDQQRSCGAAPEQKEAEQLSLAPLDGPAQESLQLVSELKDLSSSCAVDVSTVWWEAAGSRELCVVTACESSVTLWKPLVPDRWEKVQIWQLGEIPVIQIVPLPDACNVVCIALGDLEIAEIRLLLYSSEHDSFKQSLLKTGTIKAVLGLKERRLVSSCRTVQEQQVEITSLSETGGSKDRQTLLPPEETVLAFAEVEGMGEALVGTTAANSVVVWNLKTGQLLRKMPVGYSYPASICHRAYADSGLLFVVLSHPHAKESEARGNPAFCVIAFNPRTARSRGVMFSSLPHGHAGRQVPGASGCVPLYLEGDVRDTLATAVLTSGAIAVWDLLLGHCTALLPPGSPGTWALARWATAGAWLLAGRRDGTVCLYQY
ncbi:PALB2 protein, partial [Upupa epops]|nr:PALB2 protein [Upupa epops]